MVVFEGYCVFMVLVFIIGIFGFYGVVEIFKIFFSGLVVRFGVRYINVIRILVWAIYFFFLSWVFIVIRGIFEG